MLAAVPRAMPRGGRARVARSVIVIGTIPIVILGGSCRRLARGARCATPPVIAVTLVVGGFSLIAAERLGSKDRTEDR